MFADPLNGCVPSDLVKIVHMTLGNEEFSEKTYLFLSVDQKLESNDSSRNGYSITLFSPAKQKKFTMILFSGMYKLVKVSEVVG